MVEPYTVRWVKDTSTENRYYIYHNGKDLRHMEEDKIPKDMVVGVAYPVMEDMITQDISVAYGALTTPREGLDLKIVIELERMIDGVRESINERGRDIVNRIRNNTTIFFGLDTDVMKYFIMKLAEIGMIGYIDQDIKEKVKERFGTEQFKEIESRHKIIREPRKLYKYEFNSLESFEEVKKKDGLQFLAVLFQDFLDTNKTIGAYSNIQTLERKISNKWKAILRAYREATTSVFLGSGENTELASDSWRKSSLYYALEFGFERFWLKNNQ